MLDFLVATMQGLCLAMLAWGAYVSLTWSAAPSRRPAEAWTDIRRLVLAHTHHPFTLGFDR